MHFIIVKKPVLVKQRHESSKERVNLCRDRKNGFMSLRLPWQEKSFCVKAVEDFGDQILLLIPYRDKRTLPRRYK